MVEDHRLDELARNWLMPSLAVLLNPSRIAIQPHLCPKCLGPMVLARIKPARIGFEMRTFQGVDCDHVDKVVTETYSMRWMSIDCRYYLLLAPRRRSWERFAGPLVRGRPDVCLGNLDRRL